MPISTVAPPHALSPQTTGHILHLDRNHAALVLLVRRQFAAWLVHTTHQGMGVGIDRQHGVALHQLTERRIPPAIPQLSQRTRRGEIYTTRFACP